MPAATLRETGPIKSTVICKGPCSGSMLVLQSVVLTHTYYLSVSCKDKRQSCQRHQMKRIAREVPRASRDDSVLFWHVRFLSASRDVGRQRFQVWECPEVSGVGGVQSSGFPICAGPRPLLEVHLSTWAVRIEVPVRMTHVCRADLFQAPVSRAALKRFRSDGSQWFVHCVSSEFVHPLAIQAPDWPKA